MDSRTKLEKLAWDTIGPPLYYCSECLKAVRVTAENGDVTIDKPCGHVDAQVIAPRKATMSGRGFAGLSFGQKVKVKAEQMSASITGRCV